QPDTVTEDSTRPHTHGPGYGEGVVHPSHARSAGLPAPRDPAVVPAVDPGRRGGASIAQRFTVTGPTSEPARRSGHAEATRTARALRGAASRSRIPRLPAAHLGRDSRKPCTSARAIARIVHRC